MPNNPIIERVTLDQIPQGSKLKVTTNRGEEILTFQHLDGMYSLITADDNTPFHLRFNTPLKKFGEYYELDYKPE